MSLVQFSVQVALVWSRDSSISFAFVPRAKHVVGSGVTHTVPPVSAIMEGLPRHGTMVFKVRLYQHLLFPMLMDAGRDDQCPGHDAGRL